MTASPTPADMPSRPFAPTPERTRRSIPTAEILAAAKIVACCKYGLESPSQWQSIDRSAKRDCKQLARRILLAADAVRTTPKENR